MALDDLTSTKEVTKVSNLIDPTTKEIKSIVTALKEGKSYKEIKKEIRRKEGVSNKGFSFGQIKEIDIARRAKIASLKESVEDC